MTPTLLPLTPHPWRLSTGLVAAAVAAAVLAAPATAPVAAAPSPSAHQVHVRHPSPSTPAGSPNAVIAWNAHAGAASVAACFIGGNGPAGSPDVRHDAHRHPRRLERHRPTLAAVRRRPARPPGTSTDAAVATAARDVLVPTLGSFSFFLPADCLNAGVASVEADYAAALAGVPDGAAKTQGIALGHQAASAVLTLRADDGYDTPLTDPNFQEGTEPGEYRYTPGTPFAFYPTSARTCSHSH